MASTGLRSGHGVCVGASSIYHKLILLFQCLLEPLHVTEFTCAVNRGYFEKRWLCSVDLVGYFRSLCASADSVRDSIGAFLESRASWARISRRVSRCTIRLAFVRPAQLPSRV
jgi:hypothetical protein